MRRLAGHKPLSGPADRWNRWMDLIELNWCNAMEAARSEYAETRDALQARTLDEEEAHLDDQ